MIQDATKRMYGDGSDYEAERMLVSMMMTGGVMSFPRATEDDIQNDTYKRFYRIACEQISEPNSADAKKHGVLVEEWIDLIEETASSANIDYWSARVRRNAAIRRVIDSASDDIASLRQSDSLAPEVLSSLISIDDGSAGIPRAWEELAREARKVRENMRAGFYVPDNMKGIASFVYDFAPGDQMIIAAASGVGKTSIGIEMARNYRTLFISGEMGAYSLASRMHARKYWEYVDSEKMEGSEEEQIKSFSGMFSDDSDLEKLGPDGWKYICQSCSLTKLAREFARAKAEGFQCILIDYLQLMTNPGNDRRNEIASIARGTKQLAQKYGIRSILLSQLSRPKNADDGVDPRTVRPTLNRLKEAGDIEESANIIICGWLDKDNANKLILQDQKHRNAPIHNPRWFRTKGPYIRDWTEQDDMDVPAVRHQTEKEYFV